MYLSVCLSVSFCLSVFLCLSVCLFISCVCVPVDRFDKEVNDIIQELKKGGVMEVRRKPVPPLSELASVDSRHWDGLNTSYLHSHFPGLLPFTYS